MDKKKWTFMVYMAGDNNLSSAGDKDLAEMRAVGSTEEVNILAEFDNEGNRGTNRYRVQRGGADERKVSLGETDSGDPKVLVDFAGWAAPGLLAFSLAPRAGEGSGGAKWGRRCE